MDHHLAHCRRVLCRSGESLVYVARLQQILTVAQGEVVARLVFHAIPRDTGEFMLVKGSKMLVGQAVQGMS